MQEMQKFLTNTKALGGVAAAFEKNTVTSVLANKAPVLRIINREVIRNLPVQSQSKSSNGAFVSKKDVDEEEDNSLSINTSNYNK